MDLIAFFFCEIQQLTHWKFHVLLPAVNIFLNKKAVLHKFEMQLQRGMFISSGGLKVSLFDNYARS